MKQSLGKLAIATTALVCTALLSFTWSEQRGVSLSIASAQARNTQFPRYMAGNYGAYCYGLYPYGYYWACPGGGYYGAWANRGYVAGQPAFFPRYYYGW